MSCTGSLILCISERRMELYNNYRKVKSKKNERKNLEWIVRARGIERGEKTVNERDKRRG